ncbi:3' terminal RNA ribose 2'-O-methyltransferase Hen1 [Kitasatospora sp. NPDC018619]|uniref:3' terminal RNA ribose 2'-O-methyltransferase Hen1 n=1 Tax=unclassified Kitasatospora TaxID=2633591 RepID=UPI00378F78CB
MFMSISTTGTAAAPATDLASLLHRRPDEVRRVATAHGEAHVFYPEAGDEACTAALLLEVDPVALARKDRGDGRGRGGPPDAALARYVDDRPYASSSLLAGALRAAFRSAMEGDRPARPEPADRARPLRIELPAVSVNGAGEGGGPALVVRLFEPLGWQVEATAIPLDASFPEWGVSRCVRVALSSRAVRPAVALRQLSVLLPVLDGAEQDGGAPAEADELLAAGQGWLAAHPERALITRRHPARLRWPDEETRQQPEPGQPSPAEQRRAAVLAALREAGAARVADLGCGEGELILDLLKDARFTGILGVDVSTRALRAAGRKLGLERLSERQAARVALVQGALTYTDARLKGYDAAVLCEVVEHLDLPRLPALEYAVFGAARPRTVVVTTPNAEYDTRREGLPTGVARHADHRFEWSRAEFRAWAGNVAAAYGYTVELRPVGPEDEEVGAPTQLALFTATATPEGDEPR